jgi:hypothetical protein
MIFFLATTGFLTAGLRAAGFLANGAAVTLLTSGAASSSLPESSRKIVFFFFFLLRELDDFLLGNNRFLDGGLANSRLLRERSSCDPLDKSLLQKRLFKAGVADAASNSAMSRANSSSSLFSNEDVAKNKSERTWLY